MEITITISEETEQIIRTKAEEKGKNVADFAKDLLEKKVAEESPEFLKTEESEEIYENPFTPFIGMFSSGKTDTSTRYKEILREEIDKRGGFGGI